MARVELALKSQLDEIDVRTRRVDEIPVVRTRRTQIVAAAKTIHHFGGQEQSNGTDVAENGMIRVKVLRTGSQVAVEFSNLRNVGKNVANNAIQVSASILKNGIYTPVVFGSDAFARIPVDGKASGTAAVAVTEGEIIQVLWFVEPRDATGNLIAGGKWPTFTTFNAPLATGTEGVERVTAGAVNKTLTGFTPVSNLAGFGPSAIRVLDLPQTKTQLAFLGDSITEGADGTANYYGYPGLVAEDSPFFNLGHYGESLQTIITTPSVFTSRLAIAAECDVIGTFYGSNDLNGGRTAAQVKADMVAHWKTLAAAASVQPLIWQGTILPRSTSSDSFATVANQTAPSWEAARVDVNTWLRAGAPLDPATKLAVAVGTVGALLASQSGHPLWSVIDTASAVESSLNSGKWSVPAAPAPLLTTEGSHPTTAGYEAIAAVVAARIGATKTTPPTTPPPAALATNTAPRAAQLALGPSVLFRLNELTGPMAYDHVAKRSTDRVFLAPTYQVAGPGTDGDKGISFPDSASGVPRIEIPDHPDFRRLAGYSLLCWVKLAALPAGGAIPIAARVSSTSADQWYWYVISSNGFVVFRAVGVNVNEGGSALPTGTWKRLGVSYAADGTVKFYRDGAVSGSGAQAPGTGRATTGPSISLASPGNGVQRAGSYKDFMYLPRVLSDAEFAADYANR